MRVVGRAGSLPVCREIERLFLARRIWIILIQKVLELGEDVLALVLHDQVLLLRRLLLSQLFVNIDSLRVGVAVLSGELTILTLLPATRLARVAFRVKVLLVEHSDLIVLALEYL